MRRTTITLTDDLADLLEHEAKRLHVSVSELMRRLVRDAFGLSARTREIPWAGLFNDPGMVPGGSVDDELARNWARDIDRRR